MSYVYLIQSKQFPFWRSIYKIGIANDVESRLAQLQTGNPNELVIESCYEFPNAQAVETALHQRFSKERVRNEWFELTNADLEDFENICTLLGGMPFVPESEVSSFDDVDEAEEIQETVFSGDKFDYAAMFADGWRMAEQGRGSKYWNWRRGSTNRETVYGGRIVDLPHSIEDMRRIYRDENA
jgi:hypothetical protein